MRQLLLVMSAGLVAGLAGAAIAVRLIPAPAAPPAIAVAREAPPLPAIVPPGWDVALHARVSALEAKADRHDIATPENKSAAPAEAPEQASPVSEREQERAAAYQRELEFRGQTVAAHQAEAIDPAWAHDENEAIRTKLGVYATRGPGQLKDVDCRDKTCTATVQFPTPTDALAYARNGAEGLAAPGCHSHIEIPTLPEGSGQYDLTVIYLCR